jgi:hypothetical protein
MWRLRFVPLAVIVLLASTACFDLSEIAVENRTGEFLHVAYVLDCGDARGRNLQRLSENTIPPGRFATMVTLSGGILGDDGCVVVATRSNPDAIATAPLVKNGLYRATTVNGRLELTHTGTYSGARSFDLTPPTWVWIVFGVPFALGGVVALWLTLRYFYSFYVKHIDPTAPPERPRPPPPPGPPSLDDY